MPILEGVLFRIGVQTLTPILGGVLVATVLSDHGLIAVLPRAIEKGIGRKVLMVTMIGRGQFLVTIGTGTILILWIAYCQACLRRMSYGIQSL